MLTCENAGHDRANQRKLDAETGANLWLLSDSIVSHLEWRSKKGDWRGAHLSSNDLGHRRSDLVSEIGTWGQHAA